jgi:hypothetical protein
MPKGMSDWLQKRKKTMATRSFTTSDQIKDLLAVTLDTEVDDWKRDSKKKNAEGLWVRQFTNGATHETVSVTQGRDGSLMLKTGNGELIDISVEVGELRNAMQIPPAAFESDRAKNDAADKVVAYMTGETDEPEDYREKDRLVDEAGRALANRYCFAVSQADGIIYCMMTPGRYFERTGACSDATGPLSHLMPNCSEMCDATWEIGGVNTPVEGAKYLHSLGFVWNSGFQDVIDDSYTQPVAHALTAAYKKERAAKHEPKAPEA